MMFYLLIAGLTAVGILAIAYGSGLIARGKPKRSKRQPPSPQELRFMYERRAKGQFWRERG